MEINLKRPSLSFILWICLLALVLFPSRNGAQTTAPGEWTWVGGNNAFGGLCVHGIPCESGQTFGNVGVYGTLGVPAAGNIPGSRSGASTWVDSTGNLWLFGGYGIDSANTLGQLNDLWKFNPSVNEWTWMSGSSTILSTCTPVTGGDEYCGQLGVYGTLGVPAAGNVPAGRRLQIGSTAAATFGSSEAWTQEASRSTTFGNISHYRMNGHGSVVPFHPQTPARPIVYRPGCMTPWEHQMPTTYPLAAMALRAGLTTTGISGSSRDSVGSMKIPDSMT